MQNPFSRLVGFIKKVFIIDYQIQELKEDIDDIKKTLCYVKERIDHVNDRVDKLYDIVLELKTGNN